MKKYFILIPILFCLAFEAQSQFSLVKNLGTLGGAYEASITQLNTSTFLFTTAGTTTGLWVSDGTPAGTVQIKTFPNSDISAFLKIGSLMYFNFSYISGGVNVHEFWKTDGTTAGTVLINNMKILNGGQAFDVGHLTKNWATNSSILFYHTDGNLWSFDTNTQTAGLLKAINPSGNASIFFAYSINGVVYFRATHSSYGRELWKSDGTTAGTVLVYDYDSDNNPATIENGDPLEMGLSNNTIFFDMARTGSLWKTDGTTAGTVQVSGNNVGGYSCNSLKNFVPINSTETIFLGSSGSDGYVVYKTDGTTTSLVKYNVNVYPSLYYNEITLVPVGTQYFFKRRSSISNDEIWKTDGSTAGTVIVKEITFGNTVTTTVKGLVGLSNNAYFIKDNDNGNIHISDGTLSGTIPIALPSGVTLSNASKFFVWNGSLYFKTYSSGYKIYKYTPAGPCPTTLIVTSSTSFPYKANDYITTTGPIVYNSGNVVYQAGKSIVITPTTGAWQASNGMVFEAKIAGCQ